MFYKQCQNCKAQVGSRKNNTGNTQKYVKAKKKKIETVLRIKNELGKYIQ